MTETGIIKLTAPQRKLLARALELTCYGKHPVVKDGWMRSQDVYDGWQDAAGVRMCRRLDSVNLLEIRYADKLGCECKLTQAGMQIAESLEEAAATAASLRADREEAARAEAARVNHIQPSLPQEGDEFDKDHQIYIMHVDISHRATYAVAAKDPADAERKLSATAPAMSKDAVQLGKTVANGRSVMVASYELDLTSAQPHEIRTTSDTRYAAADRLDRERKGS